MTAKVSIGGFGSELDANVTRWGFVLVYKDPKNVAGDFCFYIYDYGVESEDGLRVHLNLRQHQTFNPLSGLKERLTIDFENQEDKEKFETIDKKLKSLLKRIKVGLEEITGKAKADLSLL